MYLIAHIAQVGGYRDPAPIGQVHRIAEAGQRIMAGGKGSDLHIPGCNHRGGGDLLHRPGGRQFAPVCQPFQGLPGGKQRNGVFFQQYPHALDMVDVLMGEEQSPDGIRTDVPGGQSGEQRLAGYTGVHQNTAGPGADIGAVPGRTAVKSTESCHCGKQSSLPKSIKKRSGIPHRSRIALFSVRQIRTAPALFRCPSKPPCGYPHPAG